MVTRLKKHFETCPMLARSDWGVGHIHQKGLTHSLSPVQSPVGFHGPRVGGWLVFLNGCHRGEDMRLPIGETKIGSSWLSDVVLTGIGVGSQHANIRVGSDEASVTPRSAERILKINNSVISSETKINDGCLISFGELHCIFRRVEQFSPGYRPPSAPYPTLMPNQPAHHESVCGWVVISNGPTIGQDFRLISGSNRIGSEAGLEVAIADPDLGRIAFVLDAGAGEGKIKEITPGTIIFINDQPAKAGDHVHDSDSIRVGGLEGYIKWFRY